MTSKMKASSKMKSQFEFEKFETQGGGLFFKKCLDLKLLRDPILKKLKVRTLNILVFNVDRPKYDLRYLSWGSSSGLIYCQSE